MIPRLIALAFTVALGGCYVPIARFTAIGNPPSDAGETPPARRVRGESCRWWIFGATLGLPRIEEAVDDALRHAGTTGVLRDVELVSFHPVYGPLGRHCYLIIGTAADATGSP